MSFTGFVASALVVVMAWTPALGFGGDWDKAYTSPAAGCRVVVNEITMNGGPSFDCEGGKYTMPSDEAQSVVASVGSGSEATVSVNYDKTTSEFELTFSRKRGTGEKFAGGGIIPVCIDSGHVTKKGPTKFFTDADLVNLETSVTSKFKLQWDRCYQGQTAGIQIFSAVFNDVSGISDPGVMFHGSPYRYFSVVDDNKRVSYGVSWVDNVGEWTVEYNNSGKYKVTGAFMESELRFKDWPDWWQENILEYCRFGLVGANPINVGYGHGQVLPPVTNMHAVTETPCYQSRLTAFQEQYFPDNPVNDFSARPYLVVSDHTGAPDFNYGGRLWDAAFQTNGFWSDFPNLVEALDNGKCKSEEDTIGSDFLSMCAGEFQLQGDYLFIKYDAFRSVDGGTYNDPNAPLNKGQLGYARMGVAGGVALSEALQFALLVPTEGNEVGSGQPPLTGFDPDPTNPNPNTQTYIYYDYSTGDTINTGVCVHSSCVWNTWINNAPVYEAPTYQGPAWICEDTILCLDNWNAWWQSSMNYTNALSKSWMDFIHGEAVWIVGILYPQNAPFDPFTMLLALIQNNAATVSLRNVQDGVLSSFEDFFWGQSV